MSFARADAFIVLASTFETFLRDLGIQVPIHIETTAIDENLVTAFDIDKKSKHYLQPKHFLFFFYLAWNVRKGLSKQSMLLNH